MDYVSAFEKLGFGMFVHFGLYSKLGKGEWYLDSHRSEKEMQAYEKLTNRFNVNKNWAKNLVKLAKKAGCKYINLTTRHHDGFSLYDFNASKNPFQRSTTVLIACCDD